jgi:hypothetical protein
MSRRWLLILGMPLLVVLVAAGALALFRKEGVAWLLERELAKIGYADASFTVAAVGLDEVVLTDVTAGPARAARVEVRFAPLDLLAGKLDGARVVDLVLAVDLTGAGPVLPGLGQPATMTGTGTPVAPSPGFVWSALPPLTLANATIVADTLMGPAQIVLDGDLAFAGAAPSASFAMAASGPLGAVEGSLTLTLASGDVLEGAAVLESGYLDLPGGQVQGLSGELDFRVGGDQPPRLRSELSLTAIEVQNRLFDTADLLVVLEDGQFLAEGRLRSPDRKAEAQFKASADRLLGEPLVATELALKLEAGAALWPLLGLAQPTRGEIQLRLKGDGTLQPVDELSASRGGIPGWLAGGSTRGRVDLDLIDLAFAGAIEGLNGQATVDWGLLEGLIIAGLPQDLRLTAAALDPTWLEAIGLPPDTAQALAGGATLEAPAEAAADPRIYLQPSAEGHLLDLAGTLRVETPAGARAAIAGVLTADLSPRLEIMALAIQGLAIQAQEIPADGHVIGSLKIGGELNGDLAGLSGPLAVQLSLLRTDIGGYPVADLAIGGKFQAAMTPDRLELTLREPGTLSATQVSQGEGGNPILPGGAKGTVVSSVVTLDWSAGFKISHDSLFRMADQRLSFGTAASAVPVTGDFGKIHLVGETTPDFDYVGTLDIGEANIALPGYGLVLGGTTFAYVFTPPDQPTPPAALAIKSGKVTTTLGTVSGMSLDATLEETPTTTTITGQGRGPGGQGKLSVKLTDDEVSGKGGVDIDWGPVTFKAGGTQPGSLLDYFGDFKKFSGGLRVQLRFAWTATSDSSLATVTLSNAGFEHPQATVEGLDAKVTLNRLSRLSTLPNQTFSAKLIDIGVPLRDVTGKLQIEAGKSSIYTLSDVKFTLFGGAWSFAKLRIDPRAAAVESAVDVVGLDLAELARELAIDDFSLEGRMSGRLPFSYGPADETVVISGGRLTNTTPGAIHYGQPGTAELRSGGDDNFALALEALENFQYSTFDLTIDKAADGKARLGIVLEGKNPEVLDGFPFRININLQTDLTQVLAALRDGYRLNPDLFKGGWDFQ